MSTSEEKANTCQFTSSVVQTPDPGWEIKGYWFYGKTGTGKSYTARAEFPDAFIMPHVEGVQNVLYRGEYVIIVDNFDHKELRYTRRRQNDDHDVYTFITDMSFQAALLLKPKIIVVCSVHHPHDFYGDSEMGNMIDSCFEIREFTKT